MTMSRALAGAALLLTGCSLLVSVDGLSGGAPSRDEPGAPDGGVVEAKTDGRAPGSDAGDGGSVGATKSAYAREVLADTPSIYLRFGDAPGATAVKNETGPLAATYPDQIALGTPGALAGDPDTAITFEGGIIELPVGQECDGASECVLELWMRIEAIQDGYGWLVDHEVFDPRQGWLLQTLDGSLTFERWSADHAAGAVYNQVTIAFHEWHHVAGVADSNGMRLYYDGELREHHDGVVNPIPATKTKWTVGGTACFDCSGRSWYKGAIDELAVYEHSLTEERIKTHYAVGRGK